MTTTTSPIARVPASGCPVKLSHPDCPPCPYSKEGYCDYPYRRAVTCLRCGQPTVYINPDGDWECYACGWVGYVRAPERRNRNESNLPRHKYGQRPEKKER